MIDFGEGQLRDKDAEISALHKTLEEKEQFGVAEILRLTELNKEQVRAFKQSRVGNYLTLYIRKNDLVSYKL
jgi:hypothetical protein